MKDKFETFRASEKERQALKALAKKAHMSKSDFIRHAIFNKEIVVIDGLRDLTRELKAIGNNLNQIARAANAGFEAPPITQEIQEEVELLWQLLKP